MARHGWSRKYPPLVAVVVALILAVFALPSALNLPVANPGQTLEYAPVPGDNGQAPPGGNLAGLGLGSATSPDSGTSGGTGLGGSEGLTPPQPPSQFQCVGNPPRQTEDPLSPPCVPFFRGDNGGATHQGVTASEIRIVVYQTGGQTTAPTSEGTSQMPTNTYDDLWNPPPANEEVYARGMRVLQTYFNTRYQMYGRRLHIWMYYNGGGSASQSATDPVLQKSDAAQNFQDIHPFAVLTGSPQGMLGPYAQAMESKGVLYFGGITLPQLASSFDAFPSLSWDFLASFDEEAAMYASFICTRIVPYPVSFSGPAFLHQRRVYGLLYADDPTEPDLKTFAMDVKTLVQQCGVTFAETRSNPQATYVNTTQSPDYAYANMAAFSKAGVTTIIWPAGWEPYNTKAAAGLNYYPEWVLAGDTTMEDQRFGSVEDQSEWKDAVVLTPEVRDNAESVETTCEDAYRSISPSVAAPDLSIACEWYDDLRLLATAIQASGPRLTVGGINTGLHAIPPHSSSSPDVPACYFDTNEYTCTKDAMLEWWDPSGNPGSGQGCWRMVEGGLRHRSGFWPAGDAGAARAPSDPCNTYGQAA